MEVSIIIVNWNSVAYLRECVASIYERTLNNSFEIIVVDNASPSGDAGLIESQLPQIKLVKSGKNLGFAAANNLGFWHSSGDYILFLNPDTKMIDDVVQELVLVMRSTIDAGIIGCRLLNTDLSLQTSCIQTFPTIPNQLLDSDWLRQRWPRSRLWGTQPLWSADGLPSKVQVVSGACMFVRREVFERVGLFTEDYFMYAEDVDLCYKTVQNGYSNYYSNDVSIIHHGGKSSTPIRATQMKWRSIVYFCRRRYGVVYAVAFRIAMVLASVARLIAITTIGPLVNAGSPQSRHSSSLKWKSILRTMLSPNSTLSQPIS